MKSWADFKGILPYAGGLFGIYQPQLRRKSSVIGDRLDKILNVLYPNPQQARSSQRAPLQVKRARVPRAELPNNAGRHALIRDLKPTAPVKGQPQLAPTIDSGIARLLQREIGSTPPRDWRRLITTESMTTLLERLKTIVSKPTELQNFPDIANYVQSFTHEIGTSDQTLLLQSLVDKEARVSGFLLFLARHKPAQLNELFYTAPQADNRPAA